MPARIRIQTDRISADLAAGRLRDEGIPAEVVADSDPDLRLGGAPSFLFSLLVPSQDEERARMILDEVDRPGAAVARLAEVEGATVVEESGQPGGTGSARDSQR